MGREHDEELKDRVGRLMAFLRELVASRSRPVLQLERHLQHYWLAEALSFAQIHPLASAGETVLRAPRISLDPAPALPEALHGWVDLRERDDSRLAQPTLKSRGPDPQQVTLTVDLDDALAVRSAYDRWLPRWQEWARVDRERRPQFELYQALAAMRQQLHDQPESVELVVAGGLLEARGEGEQVRTHLVTQQATVEQDSETGDLLCVLAPESALNLEDSQLLTGHPLFDSSGTAYLRERLTEVVASVLDPEILAFLKEWAARAATSTVEVGDDTASLPLPRLHPAPALVLRKRGAFALLEYYDRMIRASEREGEPVPLGIAQLVEAIEPEERLAWLERTGAAAAADLATDPLFPLPANEEQAQIITRLGGDSGVVVEGPPGTGKTHTIANLMSSLLASGQRILVTSEKAQALRVLREKLPPEMQELCVSITDVARGGSAELSRSVASLAARKSSFNPAAEDREIRGLDERRRDLKQRRASTLEAIRALRESETYQHPEVARGYAGTAAAIARLVSERRDRYSWLPLPAEGDRPVSATELERLLALQATHSPQRAARIPQAFPAEEVLPTPATVRELADRVHCGADAAADADERLRERIGRGDLDLLALVDRLRQTSELAQSVRGSGHDWTPALADLVLAGRESYLWQRVSGFEQYVDVAQQADAYLGLTQVTGLDSPGEDARLAFLALADYLAAGGALKKMFKSDQQKAAEPWLAAVRVNGQPMTTADQARQVQAHLDVYAQARALQQLLAPLSVPVATTGDRPVLVGQLLGVRESIHAVRRLVEAARVLGETLSAGPGQRVVLTSLDDVEKVASEASALVATHEAQLATKALERLAADIERSVDDRHGAPEVWTLTAALGRGDADAYEQILLEVGQALQAQTDAVEHADLLTRLGDSSPGLRRLIEQHPADEVWASRVIDWPGAWEWARAATWVERISDPGRDAQLNENLAQLDADLGRTTAQLAAARSWRAAMARMTAAQVQALQAYRDNLANVGMGTGKYAERYRQAARSAMEVAQGAVPAWVMPLQQVLASIPAQQNTFDVVIVDEASQADITSLFLLWLAPRVIVVGDDKQCTPSEVTAGALDKVFERLDSYLHDVPPHLRATLTPRSSIFSMLRTRFGQVVRLREHFRCMPEIITWSSQMFYRDAPLIPVRQFGADRLPPLRSTYVPGGYAEGSNARLHNPVEAEAIVETIERCLQDPAYDDKTFGVVVLQGQAQVDVIRNALMARIPSEVIDERRLRVGTPPDFQGDERHVVLLSMVVGPEQRFATLTKNEYQRRFNVAASRAQDQLWLFHSVTTDRLSAADLRHSLLSYMLAARQGPALPMPQGVTVDRRHDAFDSLFEQRVFLDLVAAGFHVTPQVEVNHRRIDLVVTGRGSKLAVECDGDAWHTTAEQVQSDLDRELELRRCGWTFWRVRESEYYLDKDRALSSLWSTLDDLAIGPFQADLDVDATELAQVWTPASLPDDESPLTEEGDTFEPGQEVAAPAISIVTLAERGPEAPIAEPATPPVEFEQASAQPLAGSSDAVVTTQRGYRRMTSGGDDEALKTRILQLAVAAPVSNGDVRAATGLDGVRVLELLTQLVAEGRMFRTGQRRGTRYHLRDSDETLWGDAQSGSSESGSVPESGATTVEEDVLELDPAGLAGLQVISTWLAGLDDRQLDIVRQRLVAAEPVTLEELGTTHGVSRERIRQLESRLIAEARGLSTRAGGGAALLALIEDLRERAGSLAPLVSVLDVDHERDLTLVSRVLLWMAEYVCTDKLLLLEDFALPEADYLPLVGDGPLVDREALHEELIRAGVHSEHLPVAEAALEGVKEVEGQMVLWPRSAVERCLAILTVRAEPMDVETLIENLDEKMSERSLRQRLYEDERFLRASKDRIGLRAWGGDEYTSIVSLMRAAVSNGPRSLAEVAVELQRDFDVRPNSVISYSRAPLFVVEDGKLRLRGADEPFTVSARPQHVPGLYRSSENKLIWHCRVDEELQRGSGRVVPKEIAMFLDLEPGMTLELAHGSDHVMLSWLRESHLGPSLGSLRAVATDIGAGSGDMLRLVFSRDLSEITAEVVDTASAEETAVQAVARLTGLPERQCNSQAGIAGAVDTNGAEVAAVLRARGDIEVADLVASLPRS